MACVYIQKTLRNKNIENINLQFWQIQSEQIFLNMLNCANLFNIKIKTHQFSEFIEEYLTYLYSLNASLCGFRAYTHKYPVLRFYFYFVCSTCIFSSRFCCYEVVQIGKVKEDLKWKHEKGTYSEIYSQGVFLTDLI